MNHLARPGSCDVRFLDFALPVALGSLAGIGADYTARRLLDGDHKSTQDAGAAVARAIAFWVFGGLTFVLRQRHRH